MVETPLCMLYDMLHTLFGRACSKSRMLSWFWILISTSFMVCRSRVLYYIHELYRSMGATRVTGTFYFTAKKRGATYSSESVGDI